MTDTTQSRDGAEARARLGVDIGGTFTDVALEVGTTRYSAKVLTTVQAPERGVLQAVDAVAKQAGIAPGAVSLIIHGTTLATNALIERKGAKTVLITTEGFRDTIALRTEQRYEQYDLQIDMPTPLVPRRHRYTVRERVDARGNVLIPLDEAEVLALIERLKPVRPEAVAVGFLHSYLRPEHEQQVGELLRRHLPDAAVSLSSDVSPEMREYERISTTCANAYVQPRMASYLTKLQSDLAEAGYVCPLLLMLSGGGVTNVETAVRYPVRLVESGPAGGAIFSSHLARQMGTQEVLSFDMGGTTAKICLIDGSQPQTSRVFEVARVYRFKKGSGLPLRIPVIEMVEIGAGGGSIATVDMLNRISVGPESAGSEPGPACYGRGGTEPTVTDADVILGRVDPDAFAGGSMTLDSDGAAAALEKAIGSKLELTPALSAYGVSEIVDENMANAARVHAIESAKDVTARTMIAFGGAAPLHVARVAEKLGVRRFVVPGNAGVGSAVGFLRAPVAYEIVRSNYQLLGRFDAAQANSVLAAMQAEAAAVVRQAAFRAPLIERRIAFMRYLGQGSEIPVEVPVRDLGQADAAFLKDGFDREYSRLYSRTVPGVDVELLAWTLLISAESQDLPSAEAGEAVGYDATSAGIRTVFDAETGGTRSIPVYWRPDLQPGARIPGPAVITESETTTYVSDLFDAVIDGFGSIVCTRRDT